MLFVSVGFCVGAMFYSLELLHCLKEQSFFIPIQISGAVCMFGFLMVANCDHNLFKRAWHQMFPVCHEKQSFNIVAELLDDSMPMNLRSELYVLQRLHEWPSLKLNPVVRIPKALLDVFSHDSERAHSVYAIVVSKAYCKFRIEPSRLVGYVMNNWNGSIYNQLLDIGVEL